MKVYAASISRLADIADYLTLSYSPGFDTIYAGTSTSAYGIVAYFTATPHIQMRSVLQKNALKAARKNQAAYAGKTSGH